MKVEIFPGTARGVVAAPPSKSMAHRYLIAAALAEGKSAVHGVAYSEDILATIDCLRALGVAVVCEGDTVFVTGGVPLRASRPLLCRESGSTLRFMLPLCLLSGTPAILRGSRRLLERPLTVYEELCAVKCFSFTRDADAVAVCGRLSRGDYTVDGGVSSQFISGLIFALIACGGESRIRLTGKVESRSYIDLTLCALREFGFPARWAGEAELEVGGAPGAARDCVVEGDYSNAAVFEALNLLGGAVEVTGLRSDSLQGDRVYRDCFKALSAGSPVLSLADCPDLGPVLFAAAAALQGGTFTDTARLKIKESDRGAAMAAELLKCGVKLELEENRIVVPGGELLPPDRPFSSHNDHRIVMAAALLATRTGGIIEDAGAVAKSMPDFFEKLSSLGIEVQKDEVE